MVGVPKRSSDEACPISVGSVWTRAWSCATLPCFPLPFGSQWHGRKDASIAAAFADWWGREKDAVLELDIYKAFDTVDWSSVARSPGRCGGPYCWLTEAPRPALWHGSSASGSARCMASRRVIPALQCLVPTWGCFGLHGRQPTRHCRAICSGGHVAGFRVHTAVPGRVEYF